ncbi:lipoprotein [Streptomyces griseus subsp. rhodochrous]|nr:lipoprotein [Streptomyces griseus subsp. rhodochrous]
MLVQRRSAALRSTALATAAVAAVLALGGCDGGGGDGASDAARDTGPGVVAPGRPGEPARTLSAEEAAREAGGDTANSADFRYARMMIQHHAQALVMTGLVPDRASADAVKRLAERISAGQKPEIGAMEGWLKKNDGDQREQHHDHGGMPGMATEAQLKKLRAAEGEAFDRLFLELMVTHHQGAITMATEALTEGNDVFVEEMASDVVAQQTVEIDRMRGLLD